MGPFSQRKKNGPGFIDNDLTMGNVVIESYMELFPCGKVGMWSTYDDIMTFINCRKQLW